MNTYCCVGTRPQFIKASLLSKDISLVNVGQHYDYKMAKVFFEGLELPEPKYNLEVKSNNISEMIYKLDKIFLEDKPEEVIVIGDCNTTLAGAISAHHHKIPITHLEAGMRSGDYSMVEELNRIAVDHLSTTLIPPTQTAIYNLMDEQITGEIKPIKNYVTEVLQKYNPKIEEGDYAVLTIHRQANTDNINRLKSILRAIDKSDYKFIFPVHPRTLKVMNNFNIKLPNNITTTEPLSYKRFIELEAKSKFICTDSGGVQCEADYLNKPCLVLRPSTEWIETLERKSVLVDTDEDKILKEIKRII